MKLVKGLRLPLGAGWEFLTPKLSKEVGSSRGVGNLLVGMLVKWVQLEEKHTMEDGSSDGWRFGNKKSKSSKIGLKVGFLRNVKDVECVC